MFFSLKPSTSQEKSSLKISAHQVCLFPNSSETTKNVWCVRLCVSLCMCACLCMCVCVCVCVCVTLCMCACLCMGVCLCVSLCIVHYWVLAEAAIVCLIFVEKSLSSHLPSVAILQLPPVLPSVSQHILWLQLLPNSWMD